uniref:Ninja-family protein n=1 Tax=Chenopodium quinoa TaxID=63459 RepID=A0A803L7S2_CHEQI
MLIGSSSCGDTRSPPSSTHSLPDRDSQETMGPSGTKDNPFHRASRPEPESSSKQPESTDNKKKETASGGIEDMPCVFTIGDGPNGRKVEGILYKYGKGEEVRIMCVCHGTFHSPKEFVKHAGGRDVEHPLRHIVVSPSTSPFQ